MENSATNGLENTDNVVIDRKKFIKLLNRQCRLEYMLTLLGAICYAKKIKYVLTPEDVCEILGIDYTAFKKALLKTAPKSTSWSGGRVYTLETMAGIAEITSRPQRLKKLSPTSKKRTFKIKAAR